MIIRLFKEPTQIVVTYLLNEAKFNLIEELSILMKEEFTMRDFISRNGYASIINFNGVERRTYTATFARVRRSA